MRLLTSVGMGGSVVLAGDCSTAGVSSMLTYFKNIPLSRSCLSAGPWSSSARPIDFLSTLKHYIPLACSQKACRADFEIAASNFQNIHCDEALAIGFALDGIQKFCRSLSLAPASMPKCSENDYLDLGPLTSQCFGIVPGANEMEDVVVPRDLSIYSSICNSTCVTSMLNRIGSLSDCAVDSPYFGGAPLSIKSIYKTTVNSMCGYDMCTYYRSGTAKYLCNWNPPNNDFTSCSSRLGAIYATPFSTTCRNAVFNGSMAYIIEETTQGNYIVQSHQLGAEPSCVADVMAMQSRLTGTCNFSLLKSLQLVQAVWRTNAYTPNVTVCDAQSTSFINGLLKSRPTSSCTTTGVPVSTWTDVFLPSNLMDIYTIASSSLCVSAAMDFVSAFPSCEWLDDSGHSMGINASTRISSFLSAAIAELAPPPPLPATISPSSCYQPNMQVAFSYYQNQPLSSACLKVGPWNSTAKTIDFLSTLQSDIPLACSVSACRADIQTSASNFGGINCDESKILAKSLNTLVNICKVMTVEPNSRRCTESDSLDLGSLPSQCFPSLSTLTTPTILDLIFPPNLTAHNTTCKTDCVVALLNRISALPDCYLDWPFLAGAPISPKSLYKTFINSMCGTDLCYYGWNSNQVYLCGWNPPYNDFTSCSSQLATLHATPFSSTCRQSVFNGSMVYILNSTMLGNYLSLSHRLGAEQSCIDDLESMQVQLKNLCNSSWFFGLQIFQSVLRMTDKLPNLTACNASTFSSVTSLLNARPSQDCMRLGVAVSTWSDVLLPTHLIDLLTITSSSTCVSAAMRFANTLPSCEWIDEYGQPTGMNASARLSSFLVAATTRFKSLPAPLSPTSCYKPSMQATFSYYQNQTLSPACSKFGPWNATTRPIDFISSLQSYIPLACSQSACRLDIQTSASNFDSINCDESRVFAKGLNNIVKICKTLSVVTNSRRCTDSDIMELGSLPAQCYSSISSQLPPTVLDLVFPPNLTALNGTCTTGCLLSLLNRISTLPDCYIDWPYLAGAPMLPKSIYKTFLNVLCGNDLCNYWYGNNQYLCGWNPPYNDFTACSSQLASVYSSPYSKACLQDWKKQVNISERNSSAPLLPPDSPYIVQVATTGNYMVKSRHLSRIPSCILDTLPLITKATCSSNVKSALRALQVVWSTSYVSTPGLDICDESILSTLLDVPPSFACIWYGFQSWSDVFLPFHLSDLAFVSRECVFAALRYSQTFPPCEWIDTSAGETPIGISVATRVTSFLVAMQPDIASQYYQQFPSPTISIHGGSFNISSRSENSSLLVVLPSCLKSSQAEMFDYLQSLPLSPSCLAFGTWSSTAKPTDFLTTLQPFIPLACFQPSCRADIEARAANFRKLPCSEAQTIGGDLSKLNSVCQRLSISLDLPTCTNQTNAIPMPSKCSRIVSNVPFLSDVIQSSLFALSSAICTDPECYNSISHSIDSLPDCQVDWPSAGGAPLLPKMLYSTYLSTMCSTSDTQIGAVDFNACPAQVATLYTTPFSSACTSTLGRDKMYILQTVIMGDYVHQIVKIARNAACTSDVAVMRARLASLSDCAPNLTFALHVVHEVITASYNASLDLPICTETQASSINTLLTGQATPACFIDGTSSVSWGDVLVPNHMADLTSIIKNTDCVEAALAAAKSLPSCEWIDPTNGDIVTGIDVSTRVSSFLLAAQSIAISTQSASTTQSSIMVSLWPLGAFIVFAASFGCGYFAKLQRKPRGYSSFEDEISNVQACVTPISARN